MKYFLAKSQQYLSKNIKKKNEIFFYILDTIQKLKTEKKKYKFEKSHTCVKVAVYSL